MGAFAEDMKFRFDSGPQQHGVKIDALVRGSQTINTSINDEHWADAGRVLLGGSAASYNLADVIRDTRIKQAGEVGHSAYFGFRELWLGVERTTYREMSARREAANADLVGPQTKIRRFLPENANGLSAVGLNDALVVLPCIFRSLVAGYESSILQDKTSHALILQPNSQIVAFTINPNIAEAAARANHKANAVRIFRSMNTVGGRRDGTEYAIQSGWGPRSRFIGSNLLFDIGLNHVVLWWLLPERQFRGQVNGLQSWAKRQQRYEHHKKCLRYIHSVIDMIDSMQCHAMSLSRFNLSNG